MTRGPGYLNAGSGFAGSQTVFANVETPVAYPTDPSGPVPPDLRWVVLTNASPYTMLIRQGAVLGWLAAFTSDSFYAPASNGQLPLTYLALQPTSDPQPGFNHQLFSAWYESDPGGIYPANVGAGEVKLAANSVLFDSFITPAGGLPFTTTVLTDQFAGVAIFVNDLTPIFTTFVQVQVEWENGAGVFIGGEDYVIAPGNSLTVRRPAGGARLGVIVNGGAGPNTQWQLTITGLIHATPGWGGNIGGTSAEGILMPFTTVNVVAGATTTLSASLWVYGGPATFRFGTGLATHVFSIEALDDTGTYNTIYQQNQTGPQSAQEIIVPAASLRVRGTNNTGANGNMSVVAVADMYR